MRDIRFRAWYLQEKKWLKNVTVNDTCLLCDGRWYTHNQAIPCQFTGLHDRNGKEIWEGDVINWGLLRAQGGTHAFVEFRDGKFVANIHKKSEQTNWDGCTVIGNIYENPELLEAK